MALVESLEIRFRADVGDVGARLSSLSAQLGALGAQLAAGEVQLGARASALVQRVADSLRAGAGMSSAPSEAGALLAARFAQGILGGAALSSSAAQRLSAAAKFSSASALSAARSAGAALGQGFASGISGKYGAVMAAANRIASAAVSRIRAALRIHSPSRVSFELGGFFAEGFSQGVCASIRSVEAGAAALAGGAAESLRAPRALGMEAGAEGLGGLVRAAVDEAMGRTELVIPLSVDGVKLGEASIRGINQVTRSAGRLLLEI